MTPSKFFLKKAPIFLGVILFVSLFFLVGKINLAQAVGEMDGDFITNGTNAINPYAFMAPNTSWRINTSVKDAATFASITPEFVGPSDTGLTDLSGWTSTFSGNMDDGYSNIPLNFQTFFNTKSYSSVFIGSNTYISFGAGSTQYWNLAPDSPNIPSVHICSDDNSYQRVLYRADDSNSLRIRYEGTDSTEGSVGAPTIVYEAVFYKDQPYFDLHIGVDNNCTGANTYGPSLNGVTVNGSYSQGYPLQGFYGVWPYPSAYNFTSAWQRSDGESDWTNIAGATNTSYTPTTDDINQYLRFAVTADDGVSSSTSYSDSVGIIVSTTPFLTYESSQVNGTPTLNAPGNLVDPSGALMANDENYLTTALSHVDGGYDTQAFHFVTSTSGLSYPKFTATWIGHGGAITGNKVYLSIWNFLTSSWDQLTSGSCRTDCTLTGNLTGAKYHDSNNNVWLYAKADKSIVAPTISNVQDTNRLLPITWNTDVESDSQIAYSTSSHPGTDTWNEYENFSSSDTLTTSHSLTPNMTDNNYQYWQSVTVDGNGAKMAAAVINGYIWTSNDYGATWATSTDSGVRSWQSISYSQDGSTLIATEYDGNIWTSNNDGATWASSTAAGVDDWHQAVSSNGGNNLAAIINSLGASVYYSTTSGATWADANVPNADSWTPEGLAASADGKHLFVSGGGDQYSIFMGDYNEASSTWDWTNASDPNLPTYRYWDKITSSADGSKLAIASDDYQPIYYSTTSGATWADTGSGSHYWRDIKLSADGNKIIGTISGDDIYTGTYNPETAEWTWTRQLLSGSISWDKLAGDDNLENVASVIYSGDIHTSSNGGANWINRTGTTWYYRVRSEGDGLTTISDEHSLVFTPNQSCPFLYTYNGNNYQFVVDVSTPGNLAGGLSRELWATNPFYKDPTTAYPDPEYYVKIPTGGLAPRTVNNETYYDVRITSELNEVDYLDQTALKVVDHSSNVNVFPDYRNNGQIHTISKNAPAPVSVVDQSGINVTDKIAAADNVYWHSDRAANPSYLTVKLTAGATTPTHLKLVIKRAKEGNAAGAGGSGDKLQYKNASGNFVNVPANYDIFTVRRTGAPHTSKNPANIYGDNDIRVIDLSGLTIKDNEIRLITTSPSKQWDIDWMAVDTSPDEALQVTTLNPYAADLHARGVSAQTAVNPGNPNMTVTAPNYDQLAKTGGAGTPLSGQTTKYGDVTPLLTAADDKFVIMVQGDELALKYAVPATTPDKERDFIYSSWDYHKAFNNATGDTIDPLPFNEMTQYPYNKSVENYPYSANAAYIKEYNTRVINWGDGQTEAASQIHHSLNTDYISLAVSEGEPEVAPVVSGGGSTAPIVTPQPLATYQKLDFTINNGVSSTNSNVLNISMNADTKYVSGYAISLDSNFATSSIFTYTAAATFTLPNVSGDYKVYLKYYSTSGQASDIISHSIKYLAGKITTTSGQNSTINPITGSTVNTTANSNGNSNGVKYKFKRLLKLGDRGADVKQLQILLNSQGFLITTKGVGAPGKETIIFGLATKKAVIKLQKKYNLKPYPGNVGLATIKLLNSLE